MRVGRSAPHGWGLHVFLVFDTHHLRCFVVRLPASVPRALMSRRSSVPVPCAMGAWGPYAHPFGVFLQGATSRPHPLGTSALQRGTRSCLPVRAPFHRAVPAETVYVSVLPCIPAEPPQAAVPVVRIAQQANLVCQTIQRSRGWGLTLLRHRQRVMAEVRRRRALSTRAGQVLEALEALGRTFLLALVASGSGSSAWALGT